MTENRLREIEARAQAATEGPWESLWAPKGGGEDYWVKQVPPEGAENWPTICDALNWPYYCPNAQFGEYGDRRANMEFIAHARTDIPDLIAEVRRLQQVEIAANALLSLMPVSYPYESDNRCVFCDAIWYTGGPYHTEDCIWLKLEEAVEALDQDSEGSP